MAIDDGESQAQFGGVTVVSGVAQLLLPPLRKCLPTLAGRLPPLELFLDQSEIAQDAGVGGVAPERRLPVLCCDGEIAVLGGAGAEYLVQM